MQSENVTQKRPKYIQFRSRCFKKKLCRNCPSMQPISRCVNQFFTYQVAIIVTEEELVLVKCNFFELAVDPANDLWMQRRQLSPGCKGCRQHQVLEHSRHQHPNSVLARLANVSSSSGLVRMRPPTWYPATCASDRPSSTNGFCRMMSRDSGQRAAARKAERQFSNVTVES